jgi:hypothetical protein
MAATGEGADDSVVPGHAAHARSWRIFKLRVLGGEPGTGKGGRGL